MSALPKLRYYTPEEYLALELAAEYKSQYVDGEIFAMTGNQPWHIKVAGNIFAGLHSRLRGRPCDLYFSEMRLRVKAGGMYTYPDVMALCGQAKYETTENPHSLLNPQVIVEVLSPSTEAFDRGGKFARYRLLESLTDYVLVSAERMQIEHFVRQPDGRWMMSEYNEPHHQLPLVSVEAVLPLSEIYEQVEFSDSPDTAATATQ